MQAACHESLPPRGLSFSLFRLNRKHRLATAAKRCFKPQILWTQPRKPPLGLGAEPLALSAPTHRAEKRI